MAQNEQMSATGGKIKHPDSFYRAFFEFSLDAVFLTAPDGAILAANPAACKLFGRSEEEICRVGRAGLVDPKSPLLPAFFEEREHTGRARAEMFFFRGDGSRFPGESSSQVFTDEDGQLRTVMIVRDLTRAKEVEQAKEHYLKLFKLSTEP
ncbi:MAG TPA: PAS domain S-box protein, partial [Turneriella sp.]|nr:PAS domain S-box protein [Turneriella sp.]